MSNRTISIDYEATISKARELEALAGDCSAVADSVSKLNAILEKAWKGQSGQEMTNLVAKWKNREKAIATNMETISRQIVTVANMLKEADEKAAVRNKG